MRKAILRADSYFKKICLFLCITMLNLSLNELNLIAKYRGTKGYKRMSKNKLLSIIKASEPIKNLKPSEIKEKETLS